MTKSTTTTKRPKGRKRIAILITTALLVAAGSGAAFAFWTSQGNGAGTASSGTSVPFTVTTTAATGGALTPGGPTQTIGFTVTNPGTGTQALSAISAAVATSTGGAWTIVTGAGCSAADYTVGTPTITYGQIAPGASISGTVTVTMKNLSSNQDACKNASVPLYLAAS